MLIKNRVFSNHLSHDIVSGSGIKVFITMSHLGVISRYFSHSVASWSDITRCNKIDKPLVVYRFSNVG